VITGEGVTRATESGVDLVCDQEPAVCVAESAKADQETLGRYALPSAALDGLDEHGADLFTVCVCDS
jgi:hypothetical protein